MLLIKLHKHQEEYEDMRASKELVKRRQDVASCYCATRTGSLNSPCEHHYQNTHEPIRTGRVGPIKVALRTLVLVADEIPGDDSTMHLGAIIYIIVWPCST